MFNKVARTNFPIFIGDVESCADYDFVKDYSSNSQLLISKVKKGAKLKIADYNNNKNYTIIRPAISKCRTMKIYKNANVAQKVA